ncbi:MAG TPA: glutathione S-transferase family protein [Rhizomicrobium sp.]|jgi:glutathione S-transferase|nr:glutathione S-transferase family protein [Rhizomicrobium sp.]
MIAIYAYKWVPPQVRGLVRDLRPRWALEELGIPYTEKLVGLGEDQASDWYRVIQPFGQVPAMEEGGLTLFESGSIILHLAEKSELLMPKDEAGRKRVITWVFAALNSIEPPVQELALIHLAYSDQEWTKARKPMLEEWVSKRLSQLAKVLDGKDWLEGRFTAGDLMMVTVLRMLKGTGLLEKEPAIKAYVERGEARPAFQRALAAQLAAFKRAA